MNPKTRTWLNDLVQQAEFVAQLVARGRDAFDADMMLRFAAEDLLIRLGECVSRIDRDDPEFAAAHPELELRKLKNARNLVAHGYDLVDYAMIWDILSVHVPRMATAVATFLAGIAK